MKKGLILKRRPFLSISLILLLSTAFAAIVKYNLLGNLVSDVLIGLTAVTVIVGGIIFITYIDTTPTEN
ncbi:MAG TPA: hypothetical protein PLG57_02010 [Bacteroidia bacterium]|jgi:hypothetical protein|nr:hypothetical protein [Bacteroidia bacterium]HQF28371.1 hypothetical protein [Bacteroidia bacterium]HQK97630.1 hypothetical protein [Bacteroidia bacterium]